MSDVIDSRLESRIRRKESRAKRERLWNGFKKGQAVGEVLDRPTVMTLYGMIRAGVVRYVNGAVSAGKESVLFWGAGSGSSDVALKVYLVSTSNFKRRGQYMLGDPRFSSVRKGTRNIVYLWAQKEFRNLTQCRNAGIPVPMPLRVSNNVLAMEFMGDEGRPARRLAESKVDGRDYGEAVAMLEALYTKARLVHADYSEYNIFKMSGGLVLFDLGSAVDTRHPNSAGFLKRDITNITRFFSKRGVDVENSEEVFRRIVI